jgi:adenosylcobinamide-GDP ribazoletransferase
MGFLLALQFLTRLRIFGNPQGDITSQDLASSMSYFPLVGIFLGLVMAAGNSVALLVFPPSIVAVLLMAALTLITGNLHWDGWMDTADGLLSGHYGERALAIMKDSRVGASAVIWGCLGLITQYVLLTRLLALPAFQPNIWLMATLAWSRWNAVIGTFIFPYARKTGGTAQAFLDEISLREVFISTIIATVFSALTIGWYTFALLGANFVVTTAIGKAAQKRLGGVTGDVLGAMIIAGELVGLLIGGGRL